MEAWRCPVCFGVVEGLGPSLLSIEVGDHIRGHEREAADRALASCGDRCQQLMATPTFCAARQKNPDGLTPFDVRFLKTLRVGWPII